MLWDKSEVLWKTCWGTYWELIGYLKGTYWEHIWNEGKMKKNPSLPPFPPNLKGKKARNLECLLGPSHWLHELSLPKRVSSPFLAWANTPCKQHPTN